MRSVFSVEPAELNTAAIQGLINNGIAEAEDLDFKRAHYSDAEKGKEDLASDVVAFANDRGGVLVLGMAEVTGAVASAVTPVSLADRDLRWIREVIARRTAPHVPVEFVPVPDAELEEAGCLLLVIPPSPLRPHASVRGVDLRYSRRHGTTTRHLGESEVADLYRNRFALAQRDVDRVQQVIDQGAATAQRNAEKLPYSAMISIALAPAATTPFALDQHRIAELTSWLSGETPDGIGRERFWLGAFAQRPVLSPAHRRVVTSRYDPPLELHTDGAGYAAIPIYDARRRRSQSTTEDPPVEDIASHAAFWPVLIARRLRLLAAHAQRNAGAVGDAVLLLALTTDKPVRLGRLEHFGLFELNHDAPAVSELRSEHAVNVGSLATSDPDLLSSAWRITSDLVQAWGLTEAGIFTRDGAVLATWPDEHERQHLDEFARSRGVTVER